ncbi:MAG: MFS transporter [Chitinophagales bacterium]
MKGKYRYTILGLLFLATTINYIDRQIIGLLKPTLEKEFSWTEKDYSNIVFWFQSMYAAGYLLAGRFVDFVGAKIGYALAVFFWSLAAMAHAFVRTITGFNFVRGALGFSEGGNFPAAIKAIAEWFPVKERAFASGIMISGTTVGPILAPMMVLWLSNRWGWQFSFLITGSMGLIWLFAWIIFYNTPTKSRNLSYQELKYIDEENKIDRVGNKTPLSMLLSKKRPGASSSQHF